MSERKDFYKITELSNRFHDWKRNDPPKDPLPVQTEIQYWQACFMLAIAQQLSVIASHLGKIVGKAEDRANDKD